jgi:hypothetical protein
MPSIAASTIVAQAFRFMEVTAPSSLADDTPKANDANEQYPNALEICLGMADWSFASVFVTLPEAALPPTSSLDASLPYFFRLPGDLIHVREVGLYGDGTKWRTDLIGLRANIPAPLPMRYTAKITDESRLPALFRKAVSLQLALLLGPIWQTTDTKMQRLATDFEKAMKLAMKPDALYASASRYDGEPDEGSWADEATQ